ncbi:Uncharacterised protein [uncultured archaeon]|nr:Uncharacterised protein [uncultured archaeon]
MKDNLEKRTTDIVQTSKKLEESYEVENSKRKRNMISGLIAGTAMGVIEGICHDNYSKSDLLEVAIIGGAVSSVYDKFKYKEPWADSILRSPYFATAEMFSLTLVKLLKQHYA